MRGDGIDAPFPGSPACIGHRRPALQSNASADHRGEGALKVCAVAQIRVQKHRRDVKSFSVRLVSARVAPGGGEQCRAAQRARMRMRQGRNSKVLLLSTFLFRGATVRALHAFVLGAMPPPCRCSTGCLRRCAARCRCENFSPGLLTVKKTVIRFRLSRPFLRTE